MKTFFLFVCATSNYSDLLNEETLRRKECVKQRILSSIKPKVDYNVKSLSVHKLTQSSIPDDIDQFEDIEIEVYGLETPKFCIYERPLTSTEKLSQQLRDANIKQSKEKCSKTVSRRNVSNFENDTRVLSLEGDMRVPSLENDMRIPSCALKDVYDNEEEPFSENIEDMLHSNKSSMNAEVDSNFINIDYRTCIEHSNPSTIYNYTQDNDHPSYKEQNLIPSADEIRPEFDTSTAKEDEKETELTCNDENSTNSSGASDYVCDPKKQKNNRNFLILNEAEVSDDEANNGNDSSDEYDNSESDKNVEGLIASDNSDNLSEQGYANLVNMYNEQEIIKDRIYIKKAMKFARYNSRKEKKSVFKDGFIEDDYGLESSQLFSEEAILKYGN